MICTTCGSESTHISMRNGHEYCPHCSGVSENRQTDDRVTRASSRIRIEALKFEGDTLAPKRWDKASKKVVPSEEFLKRNGTRSGNFFTPEELKDEGYGKLSTAITKQRADDAQSVAEFKYDVVHEGDATKRIKEVLK